MTILLQYCCQCSFSSQYMRSRGMIRWVARKVWWSSSSICFIFLNWSRTHCYFFSLEYGTCATTSKLKRLKMIIGTLQTWTLLSQWTRNIWRELPGHGSSLLRVEMLSWWYRYHLFFFISGDSIPLSVFTSRASSWFWALLSSWSSSLYFWQWCFSSHTRSSRCSNTIYLRKMQRNLLSVIG